MPIALPREFADHRVRPRETGHGLSTLLPCAIATWRARTAPRPRSTTASRRRASGCCPHIDLRTTARIRIFRDFMLEAIEPYVPLIRGERENAWKASR